MRKRKKIAYANIKKCWPKLFDGVPFSNHKSKALVKKSFILLGHTLGDFLWLRYYTQKNIDRYVAIQNIEALKQSVARGRGVIITTAHYGSWELAAHTLALKGFKSLILYQNFRRYPRLDAWVKKQREIGGNTLIAKNYALVSLYKEIRRGGMVTLIADQHASPSDGERSELLGQEVWSHVMFIKMSLKSGAPIVPGFIITQGLSSYTVKLCDPIDPQDFMHKADPVAAMLCEHNKIVEAMIISHPEQWMWQHNRFKTVQSK